jgi:hypothetical protein
MKNLIVILFTTIIATCAFAQRPLATISADASYAMITYSDSIINFEQKVQLNDTLNVDSLIQVEYDAWVSAGLERFASFESFKRAQGRKVKINREKPIFNIEESELFNVIKLAIDEGKTPAQIRQLNGITEARLLNLVIKYINNAN